MALEPEVMDIARAPGEGSLSASGISGSKTPRAIQCLGSTVLPQVMDSEMGAPAEQGNAIHKFFSVAAKNGRDAALESTAGEYLEVCAAFDLTKIPTVDAERFSHEVAMAYDALSDTARIIGYDIDRNYGPLSDGEIPLTIDVLGLTDDGEGAVVGDYKSGRVAVAPPKTNWQLKIGAVAVARKFGLRYVVVQIIHTRPEMKPWSETATLDAFDLDEAAEQLRELVVKRGQLVKSYQQRGFAGLGDSLVRGPECRYCPSLNFCPAQTSLVRSVVGDPLAFQRRVVALITPQQLGHAKEALSELKGLVEILEEQIKACATQQPAIMPSGKFYGPVDDHADKIDGQIAFRVLTEWIPSLLLDEQNEEKRKDKADKLARIAVTAKTSVEAITKALDPIAPKGTRASLVREARKRIEFAGGITPGVKVVCREYEGEPRRIYLPAKGNT